MDIAISVIVIKIDCIAIGLLGRSVSKEELQMKNRIFIG